jgi:hypothetical protein
VTAAPDARTLLWLLATSGLAACGPSAEALHADALVALHAGDNAAVEAIIARAGDPIAQDLLRLELAVDAPSQAGALCAKVTQDFAKAKCQQVLGRPHLQGAP